MSLIRTQRFESSVPHPWSNSLIS